MKKLLVIALLAITTTANAQGHLTFKGVEINGTLKTFVTNLEKRICQSDEDIYFIPIKADFAGVEMLVYPQTTSQSQTVYAVVAGTDGIKEEVSLKAQYDELKNLLAQKYGKGKVITLADGWYRNSINKLERGNANNALLFEAETGKIYLYIHKSDRYGEVGSINIQYIDKANEQLKLQEANTDI